MADGRHFENGFIAIFQPKIIRFKYESLMNALVAYERLHGM